MTQSVDTDVLDSAEVEAADLCEALFSFVRGFGLHRSDETPCGIPMSMSEAQALTALLDGPATPSALADDLALARSTVSRLLDRLEGEGWIKRRPDPSDGRGAQVLLSASGRRTAERVLQARHQRLLRLLSNIDPADRPEIVRSLRLLAEASRNG